MTWLIYVVVEANVNVDMQRRFCWRSCAEEHLKNDFDRDIQGRHVSI